METFPITVWKAQPGPEGPLDLCPAFFFGLVSRLCPSPRLCDIVMLNATDLPASPSLQLAVLLVWNAFYPSSESLEQFSLNREVEFRGLSSTLPWAYALFTNSIVLCPGPYTGPQQVS